MTTSDPSGPGPGANAGHRSPPTVLGMHDDQILAYSPVLPSVWHEEGGSSSEAYTVSEYGCGWRRDRWFSNPHGATRWLEAAAGVPTTRVTAVGALLLDPDVEDCSGLYLRAGSGAESGLLDELATLVRKAWTGARGDTRLRAHVGVRDNLLSGWTRLVNPATKNLETRNLETRNLEAWASRVELAPFEDRARTVQMPALLVVWAGRRCWINTSNTPLGEAFEAAWRTAESGVGRSRGEGARTAWQDGFERALAHSGLVALEEAVLEALDRPGSCRS